MERERLLRRPTREEINDMPLRHYDGPLHIVRNLSEWREAEKDLRSDCVLGFDTETRPTFRKGKLNSPSLVQLAGANAVYLVQLAWLPFGEPCAQLLADPKIIKTGVGIHDDMAALARIYPFMPQSCVGYSGQSQQLAKPGLAHTSCQSFWLENFQRVAMFKLEQPQSFAKANCLCSDRCVDWQVNLS